jgi:chemotaxis response regulator CheB
MPGSAVRLGAADQVVSLRMIPARLLELVAQTGPKDTQDAQQSA